MKARGGFQTPVGRGLGPAENRARRRDLPSRRMEELQYPPPRGVWGAARTRRPRFAKGKPYDFPAAGEKVAMKRDLRSRQDGVTPQSQEEEPKRKPEAFASGLLFGSPCWARTNDIMINSHALYRLS